MHFIVLRNYPCSCAFHYVFIYNYPYAVHYDMQYRLNLVATSLASKKINIHNQWKCLNSKREYTFK